MVVLDTNVVSLLMQRDAAALEHLRARRPGEVLLAAPVAAEIHFGLERLARGSRRRRLLQSEYRRLRDVLRWIDWTETAAREFGRQKARLAREGRRIEDMDLAIGSVALAVGARLATRNRGHLDRLEGLELEAWS